MTALVVLALLLLLAGVVLLVAALKHATRPASWGTRDDLGAVRHPSNVLDTDAP
jgi:hypothetical protein